MRFIHSTLIFILITTGAVNGAPTRTGPFFDQSANSTLTRDNSRYAAPAGVPGQSIGGALYGDSGHPEPSDVCQVGHDQCFLAAAVKLLAYHRRDIIERAITWTGDSQQQVTVKLPGQADDESLSVAYTTVAGDTDVSIPDFDDWRKKPPHLTIDGPWWVGAIEKAAARRLGIALGAACPKKGGDAHKVMQALTGEEFQAYPSGPGGLFKQLVAPQLRLAGLQKLTLLITGSFYVPKDDKDSDGHSKETDDFLVPHHTYGVVEAFQEMDTEGNRIDMEDADNKVYTFEELEDKVFYIAQQGSRPSRQCRTRGKRDDSDDDCETTSTTSFSSTTTTETHSPTSSFSSATTEIHPLTSGPESTITTAVWSTDPRASTTTRSSSSEPSPTSHPNADQVVTPPLNPIAIPCAPPAILPPFCNPILPCVGPTCPNGDGKPFNNGNNDPKPNPVPVVPPPDHDITPAVVSLLPTLETDTASDPTPTPVPNISPETPLLVSITTAENDTTSALSPLVVPTVAPSPDTESTAVPGLPSSGTTTTTTTSPPSISEPYDMPVPLVPRTTTTSDQVKAITSTTSRLETTPQLTPPTMTNRPPGLITTMSVHSETETGTSRRPTVIITVNPSGTTAIPHSLPETSTAPNHPPTTLTAPIQLATTITAAPEVIVATSHQPTAIDSNDNTTALGLETTAPNPPEVIVATTRQPSAIHSDGSTSPLQSTTIGSDENTTPFTERRPKTLPE